jgi:hypothetical protein
LVAAVVESYPCHEFAHERQSAAGRFLQIFGQGGIGNSVRIKPVSLVNHRHEELPAIDHRSLHLSPSTIDTYRERLKTKLSLKSAAELTHLATRWVLENG